jgi:hypothetical protein
MVVGESGRSDVGCLFFEAAPLRCIDAVAGSMGRAIAHGDLRPGKAEVVARQYPGSERSVPDALGGLLDPTKTHPSGCSLAQVGCACLLLAQAVGTVRGAPACALPMKSGSFPHCGRLACGLLGITCHNK